jgi:hypothetical protein
MSPPTQISDALQIVPTEDFSVIAQGWLAITSWGACPSPTRHVGLGKNRSRSAEAGITQSNDNPAGPVDRRRCYKSLNLNESQLAKRLQKKLTHLSYKPALKDSR